MKHLPERIDPELCKHWRQLLEIFRDAELAEFRAEVLKPYLDCLALAGLLEGHAVLGNALLPLYTAPVEGGADTGPYCQAALLVPGGLGVVLWSCAEHDALSGVPEGPETHARRNFVPFARCRPVVRQWLLPQIDELFAGLLEVASAFTPSAPSAGDGAGGASRNAGLCGPGEPIDEPPKRAGPLRHPRLALPGPEGDGQPGPGLA